MKFIEGGPDIPDNVLQQRDEGRVVFFCGAGVSQESGLPSFVELARLVAERLDVPEDSEIETMLRLPEELGAKLHIPLDDIFFRLQRDYGEKQVDECITAVIRQYEAKSTSARAQESVGKISSDQFGNPQIVTTNFDNLFYGALRNQVDSLCVHDPPALPRIDAGMAINGITHLHGRLRNNDPTASRYIISSKNLGLAYLAEGWATSFVRSLLDLYTVVFVGYRAEDPPFKYLLQGLDVHRSNNRPIAYAFDCGTSEEIAGKWRSMGITPIPYSAHDRLWDTLEKWACRAEDPVAWRGKLIELASKGPRACTQVQREQVRQVVMTNSGAQEFASARPSPPPEWLQVFDESRQTKNEPASEEGSGKKRDMHRVGANERLSETVDGSISHTRGSPLEWRRGSETDPFPQRLGDWMNGDYSVVPEGIKHLTGWITEHLDAPTTIWWALKHTHLHDSIVDRIKSKLREKEALDPKIRCLWNVILEYYLDGRAQLGGGQRLGVVLQRIDVEGWTNSTLREFAVESAPYFRLAREPDASSDPSQLPADFNDMTLSQIVKFEVEFPIGLINNCIPDGQLPAVFRIMEGHFRQAEGMWKDIGANLEQVPTCHMGKKGPDTPAGIGLNGVFQWFMKLFRRLAEVHPTEARMYAMGWSVDNPFCFRKLKLFALGLEDLFDVGEVESALRELPKNALWDFTVRWEIVSLLGIHWQHLPEDCTTELVNRIFEGPHCESSQPDLHLRQQFQRVIARYLKWLLYEGCDICKNQRQRLCELIAGIPDWQEGEHVFAIAMDGKSASQFGATNLWIDLNKSPISEVIERTINSMECKGIGWSYSQSFEELVRVNPEKAIEVLDSVLNRGKFPRAFWNQLLDKCPKIESEGLLPSYMNAIGQLSHEQVYLLRESIGAWFEDRVASCIATDESLAWQTLDHALTGMCFRNGKGDEDAATRESARSTTDGEVRVTLESAKSSPVGQVINGLVNTLRKADIGAGSGIPGMYSKRFKRLMDGPGMTRYYAIAVLSAQLDWLYSIAPKWTSDIMLPLFELSNSAAQAAWSGVQNFDDRQFDGLNKVMKRHILELFPAVNGRGWESRVLSTVAHWILSLVDVSEQSSDSEEIASVRRCLRCMDAHTRNNAIFHVMHRTLRCDGGWRNYFIPFVESVWPKEIAYCSSESSLQWVEALGRSGDEFPVVFSAVRHLLCPITYGDYLFPICDLVVGRGIRMPIAHKFPRDALELLGVIVPNDPNCIPLRLKDALDIIRSSDPRLTQDHEWIRLAKLWDRR